MLRDGIRILSAERKDEIRRYLDVVRARCVQLPAAYGTRWASSLPQVYVEPLLLPAAATKIQGVQAVSLHTNPLEYVLETAEENHIVVQGRAGVGKSTFLNWLAYRIASNWLEGRSVPFLPVPLSAKSFARHRTSPLTIQLHSAATEHLGQHLTEPLSDDFFGGGAALDFRWLILLDGFDDIHYEPDKQRLLSRIRTTFDRFRFVVTSRTPLYPEGDLPARVSVYELRGFDAAHTRAFAQKWFPNAPDRRQKFLTHVDTTRALDLQSNPLLLTLAAALVDGRESASMEEAKKPPRRAGLLDTFVRHRLRELPDQEEEADEERETVAKEWSRKYGENGSQAAVDLYNRRRHVLKVLALVDQQRKPISAEYMVNLAYKEIPDRVRMDAWMEQEIGKMFLGVGLVQREGDNIRFLHSSIRDLLAAALFAEQWGVESNEAKLLVYQKWNSNMREPMLLALGLWSTQGDVEHLLQVPATAKHSYITWESYMIFLADAIADGVPCSQGVEDHVIASLLDFGGDSLASVAANLGHRLRVLERLQWRADLVPKLVDIGIDSNRSVASRQFVATVLTQLGREDEATRVLRGIVSAPDAEPRDVLTAGSTLARLGHSEEAARLASTFLTTDTSLWLDAARVLVEAGRAEEAGEAARRLIAEEGGSTGAARVLMDAGCTEEAVELLGKMLIEPKAGLAHRAARLLGESGRREEAAKLLFDFFKSATSPPMQRVREAVVLSELGYETEALEALTEMLGTQRSRALAALGLSYLGYDEESGDVFKQLAEEPELPFADRMTVQSYQDYVAEKEKGFNARHPLATMEMLGDVLGLDI